MTQRWASVRIRLDCVVGGFHFEVVQATMTFELNSIPTVAVTLAVGREVRTRQPAAAHSKLGTIEPRDSFELYFRPEPGDQEGAWQLVPQH